MNHQITELEERRDGLMAEARALAETDLEGEDRKHFEELEAEIEAVQLKRKALLRLHEAVKDPRNVTYGADGTPPHQGVSPGDPWEQRGPESPQQTRSRALTAVEQWPAEDGLKESATEHLERLSRDDVRGVSAHVLRYSNPLYVSAFRKYSQDPETFAAALTAEERDVWAEAREYQRATLQTSGAVLPSPLDPTIVLTSDGSIDPMRSVARVDSTTALEKRYITSAGSTFSFDAELAEVSDDTHTETEVTITTAKAQGWIEASIEVAMDQPNFATEVAKLIGDGKAQLEAVQFIDGTGTNAPKGIQVALAGGASEINAAGEALVANDVYGLIEALPPRFRQNAKWQLELSTLNFVSRLFNPSGTEPPLVEGSIMLKRPYVENSSVDPYSDVDDTATANNYVLFIGDWSNYVILDRVGLSVAYVGPGHILNTTSNLPDGRVGWYSYWRVGADVLSISPFRLLDVATTA